MTDTNSFDNLELHIEELVLDGFPQSSRAEIARHIQHELTELIRRRGLPGLLSQDGTIPQLPGVSFEAAPNATPQALGAQVAQSLYRGLGQ